MRNEQPLVTWPAGLISLAIFLIGFCQAASAGEVADPARAGLDDSSWPAVSADLWRTSAVVGGGLPADLHAGDLVAATAELPTTPIFGITQSDDAVFVLGGSPAFQNLFTSAMAGNPVDLTDPQEQQAVCTEPRSGQPDSPVRCQDRHRDDGGRSTRTQRRFDHELHRGTGCP